MDATQAFLALVSRLRGMPCWSVIVSGVGSLANLHFGEKIERDEHLVHVNFKITPEERVYRGEIIVYLEECPWRLDGLDSVICSWMNTTKTIKQGLAQLKGDVVQDAVVSLPGYDLIIRFESGYVLRVFPDQVNADEGDNYSVYSDGKTYVLAANSTLYIE
ncbi:MAG: hypothetical protein Kow00117_07800 [Phototrophicales bacterium]